MRPTKVKLFLDDPQVFTPVLKLKSEVKSCELIPALLKERRGNFFGGGIPKSAET
jgi:hypothetical protein